MDLVEPFLDHSAPIPVDAPFTLAMAVANEVSRRQLDAWVASGLVIHPWHNVYYAAQLEDTLDLRLSCLRLVVPEDAVVTDRTAGWVQGAPRILAPNDHLRVPDVSLFMPPGRRVRRDGVDSGERSLRHGDVVELDGLQVTTPLRTALDLGMRLPPIIGVGALDALAFVGSFGPDELLEQLPDFKGYRGVTRLRVAAPEVDARCESPGESALKFRWKKECPDLPPPTPQVEVEGPDGPFYLDLGVPELRFGAEYDGVEWHGPERRQKDAERRLWLAEQGHWVLRPMGKENVYGARADAAQVIRAGIAEARAAYGRNSWRGVNPREVPRPRDRGLLGPSGWVR